MTKYLVERYLPGLTPEQLAAAASSAKRATAVRNLAALLNRIWS